MGITHTYTLNTKIENKTPNNTHKYTMTLSGPTTTFNHDPPSITVMVKANKANGTVGVLLLFQLLESGKEERNVCLTKSPMSEKIIKRQRTESMRWRDDSVISY